MSEEEQVHLVLDFRLHYTVPRDLGLDGLENLVRHSTNHIAKLPPMKKSTKGREVLVELDQAEYRNWAIPEKGYSDRVEINPHELDKALGGITGTIDTLKIVRKALIGATSS